MAILSPFVLLLWIDQISIMDYVTNPSASFAHVKERIGSLASADLIILSSGIVGAIVSGIVIQTLRKKDIVCFKPSQSLEVFYFSCGGCIIFLNVGKKYNRGRSE